MAWVSPRYKEATGQDHPSTRPAVDAPAAEAPAEQGRRLATLPRSVKGMNEELRVSLDDYQGHAYLSIRLWTQDTRSGQWWPTKKGTSIRLKEAEAVADALRRGLEMADAPGGQRQGSGQQPQRQQQQPQGREQRGPTARGTSTGQAGGGRDFDEFS